MKSFSTSSHVVLADCLQEFVSYAELKQMAYNIAALQQQKMFHSLAVLSFFPGEGKSLFCVAMALAYAEVARSKVLIVDTTTYHNEGSLTLGQCLNGSQPLVEIKSLDDLRKGSQRPNPSQAAPPYRADKSAVVQPEVVRDQRPAVSALQENDFSLLKKVTQEDAKNYGLVLLDTAPLTAKNKSNVDPLLVGRLSGASILVVSQSFLQARNMNSYLKILEDPSLHLLGVIANEEFSR